MDIIKFCIAVFVNKKGYLPIGEHVIYVVVDFGTYRSKTPKQYNTKTKNIIKRTYFSDYSIQL